MMLGLVAQEVAEHPSEDRQHRESEQDSGDRAAGAAALGLVEVGVVGGHAKKDRTPHQQA